MDSHKNKKKFCYKKYATFDKQTKKYKCLVEACQKELSAASSSNLKRHYILVHNIVLDDGVETTPSKGIAKNNKAKKINTLRTSLNREEFLKCCIGLVSKINLPLSIFDDNDFFKHIIEPYEEHFEITLNSQNISNMVGDSSQQIKSAIAKLVENKMVCLKIDVASRLDKHTLGVHIQYIRDFKICINTLGMIQLDQKPKIQYLKKEIMKFLNEFNIDIKQIYSYTTDNGANTVKDSKLLQELQDVSLTTTTAEDELSNAKTYDLIETQLSSVFSVVRCAAHTIQLAANDVIGTLKTELDKLRDSVKGFRNIVRTKGTKHTSVPYLDNATRWISTYDMIISILTLKEIYGASVNWAFVESFAIAFKPLAEFTIHMQKEQYIIGDFFRDWLKCELDLEDIPQTNSHAIALYEAMGRRKSKLLEYDTFVAALYLDPRFNFQGTPLLTNDQKIMAINHLIKTYKILDTTSSTSSNATTYSKLAQHINLHLDASNSTATIQNHPIKADLLALCEKPIEPLEIDVLKYWKNIAEKNSKLSQLAEVVLAVPATQVSVERTFTALATDLTKLKSKSSNILTTKFDFDLLDSSAINMDNIAMEPGEIEYFQIDSSQQNNNS